MKQERRKYKRFPYREEILIDGARICTATDISQGGLYISAMQCYRENDVIDVTIPLKGEKLTVKARVRYCEPGAGMRAMFIELNREQSDRIQALIERVSKKPVGPATERIHILLVEDHALTRQAIKKALSKKGFYVTEANDGIEAMKLLAEENPDLIILDLYMRGMDGLKVLSLLKEEQKWREIPVIICSGHDTEYMKEKAMHAGADAFLTKKASSPASLMLSVEAVLEQHRKISGGSDGCNSL
jgi:CheY-like chemotaxis protein